MSEQTASTLTVLPRGDMQSHEQELQTAVVAFSEWSRAWGRDACQLPDSAPVYRQPMPLARPQPGQQYAFQVDLDACSGCKACVVACHRLNGLDEDEAWRQVGLLQGSCDGAAVLQHVTTSCHHCLEPSCLQGCPVNAYEKDPLTGIVRHLDDQCIGCQYCILKCPYDAPQYNPRLGIVRKCDMCAERLSAGEAPACVQSCPTTAIRIALVSAQQVAEDAEANLFLSGAAEPAYTLPTTVYQSRRGLPGNLLPADYYAARPQHAHWPLVWMLVLTQIAVGTFAGGWLTAVMHRNDTRGMDMGAWWVAVACGLLGMFAAVFHLGRPWLAFRALLGLRRSWLSREILAFQIFGLSAAAYAIARWQALTGLHNVLGAMTLLTGLLAVLCSAMVYVDTHRAYWNGPATITKFLLTAVQASFWIPTLLWLLIAVFSHASAVQTGMPLGALRASAMWFAAAVCAKVCIELSVLRYLVERRLSHQRRTAILLTGALRPVTIARVTLAAIAALAAWLAGQQAEAVASLHWFAAVCAVLATLAWLSGEICERFLFFAAVIAPKMPGAPAS